MRPFWKKQKKIRYIVEPAEWSIKWDGRYITQEINRQFAIKADITEHYQGARRSIVHFGSRNVYFMTQAYQTIHRSNQVVFTWFHGTAEDKAFIQALPAGSRRAKMIHTSCQISKDQLTAWGAEPEKIQVIPLGVDTKLFTPASQEEKLRKRRALGIPDQAILIGSFQKDGNGWEEGDTPKLIKGPDILCNVLEKLVKNYPIYVLLTGPARGYVKNRLTKANIPFKHLFLENYHEIAGYFNILDVYLIASRAEGGPKALLEGWASGVPVVSTKVGMSVDLIRNQSNGFLVDIEDEQEMIVSTENLIEDRILAKRVTQNAMKEVFSYDWSQIAKAYYEKIYSKLI